MADTMKAVVIHGPENFSVETVPVPVPRRGEVRVKIEAVAICGSDPKLFHGTYLGSTAQIYPFIAGHEFSGRVVSLGEEVTELEVGDRVAGEAHCGCGYCKNCMSGLYNICLNYGKPETGHRHYGFTWQGAYAQYNVYNVKALTKMPDSVSYEEGTLVDTAGTSLSGISLIGLVPGGFCVVVGPGPVGLCAMMIARSMGSKVIMVGRGQRLQAAKKLGADYIVDCENEEVAARVREITGGIGADEAVECAGNAASVNYAIHSVKRGGRVVLLGMPSAEEISFPIKPVILDEIMVRGSRANPNVAENVLRLVELGVLNVKDMITHTFPLEQVHEALETFETRKGGALKVILKP
ncbi:MAG: zinc-dependent alcohol dehydrogenase [Christensenellales bacterium]|jgi:L-iditol 2-dehydrogenase